MIGRGPSAGVHKFRTDIDEVQVMIRKWQAIQSETLQKEPIQFREFAMSNLVCGFGIDGKVYLCRGI